jgi:ABC-type multidrug transport system fused ATPase/permease subunit
MFISETTGMVNPLLLAKAYDALVRQFSGNETDAMHDITRVMIQVLALHFGGVLVGFVRHAIQNAAGERLVARVRVYLYRCILKQEISFFDTHTSGELVSRLGSDTTLLQQGVCVALPEVVLGVIKVVVTMVLMFWISPPLAGVTLASVGFLTAITVPFGKYLGRLSKSYQNVLGQAQTHSTEALGSIRTVQSFAAEDKEILRYQTFIGRPELYKWWFPSRKDDTTYRYGFMKSLANAAFMSVIFGLGFGCLYIALWYGFKLVTDGELSLGKLTAFQSYVFQIGGSLAQVSGNIARVAEAQGASGRVFYLLQRVPRIPSPRIMDKDDLYKDGSKDVEGAPTPLIPSSVAGHIEFNNVSFSYPSRSDTTVLDRFSVSIPANTTTALVGSSGSGKSTVVALLQRFYDVNSGSITIDGRDIRDVDLKWLRNRIGYVQQEPQMFGLSVRENVAYGMDREVTQEEIEHACRMANAHDFIMKWPNQYDTLVGERGVQLSGGQKQRVVSVSIRTDSLSSSIYSKNVDCTISFFAF